MGGSLQSRHGLNCPVIGPHIVVVGRPEFRTSEAACANESSLKQFEIRFLGTTAAGRACASRGAVVVVVVMGTKARVGQLQG